MDFWVLTSMALWSKSKCNGNFQPPIQLPNHANTAPLRTLCWSAHHDESQQTSWIYHQRLAAGESTSDPNVSHHTHGFCPNGIFNNTSGISSYASNPFFIEFAAPCVIIKLTKLPRTLLSCLFHVHLQSARGNAVLL